MIISIPLMEVDGVPTAADTAVLRDPTEAYGIQVVSTEEVEVAAGTALTLNGDVYEYDFDIALEGVEYEAWFELTYDGDVYRTQHFFTLDDSAPTTVARAFRAAFVDATAAMLDLAAPPELANPSGTYGAKRLSNNEVIVASGSAMAEVGDGLYLKSVTLSSDDATERFRFYVHAVIDDVDFYLPNVTNGQTWSVALALGRYTNSFKVGQLVGHDNVYLWCGTPQYGTLEADEPIDFALRMSHFILEAEDRLDTELLGAYVEEAFTDDIPAIIVRLATIMAAVAMYESRGVDDVGDLAEGPAHRLSGLKKEALRDIRKIKMGLLKIGTLGYGPIVSFVETDTDD